MSSEIPGVGSNGATNGSSAQARAGERLPLTSPRGTQEQEGEGERTSCFKEYMAPMKLLKRKRVRTILFVYVLFSALSVCGAGMIVFQLLVYPRIVRHIGLTRSQRWVWCMAIPVYVSYPLLSKLHDFGRVLLPTKRVLLFFTNVAMTAVITNVSLATNNAVASSQRDTVNILWMTLGSLAKAIGPTVSSTLFTWSISRPRPFPFDRHFIFCLFGIGMLIVTAASWNLVFTRVEPEPKGTFETPVMVVEAAPEEVGQAGPTCGK